MEYTAWKLQASNDPMMLGPSGFWVGEELSAVLDRWGEDHLAPWYADHVAWDAALLSSWAGRPIDPAGPIGVETLVAAADERHPEWWPALGRFFAMHVLPAALDPLRTEARMMLRQGWQPARLPGPDRDELTAVIAERIPEQMPA